MKKVILAGSAILAVTGLVVGFGKLKQSANNGRKTLHLYVWTDYIDKDVIKEFESKHDVRVVEENFPSNEVMISKLKAGGGGFDLIVPSDYMIASMVQDNLLLKLPKEKIQNLANLTERFQKVDYDPTLEYTVPYMWGTTGFAYNSKKISNPPKSWKEFFDPAIVQPAYKRISLLDDPREVIGAALKANGHSLNSVVPEELNQAKQKLLSLKPLISRFDTMSYKDLLASGDLWIAQAYSGDVVKMQVTNPELRYVIPEDGATLWVDNLAIPKDSPNPELAAEFINFVLIPEVNKRIAMSIHYATTNKLARNLLPETELNNTSIYPTKEVEARLELFKDLGTASERIDTTWAEIRAETDTIQPASPSAQRQ
ncbi:spermidine/putrescine ABC transporter substrate-binding protein [bacterium]|nr:spermidine/putrescine ABC transporter substrate-binding protein [bacterium]